MGNVPIGSWAKCLVPCWVVLFGMLWDLEEVRPD